MSEAKFIPADEIFWNGDKVSDLSREQLLRLVEQLNWHIARLTEAGRVPA